MRLCEFDFFRRFITKYGPYWDRLPYIYCFCSGQIYAWICYDDVGFRFIHTIIYNICRSALINKMCKVYANLANCDCFFVAAYI